MITKELKEEKKSDSQNSRYTFRDSHMHFHLISCWNQEICLDTLTTKTISTQYKVLYATQRLRELDHEKKLVTLKLNFPNLFSSCFHGSQRKTAKMCTSLD